MTGFAQLSYSLESASHSLHLLIVEDMPEDVELLALTLSEAQIPYTACVADSVASCQVLLEQRSWDAVLSDFRLPDGTAYHVLAALQQLNLEIPLILLTGALGEEAAVECIRAGITDYVLKDHLFRLPTVLDRSLREYELRRQQQANLLQIQQQATREALTNSIVQAMRGTLVLEEVLQTTVDRLHEALEVSRCLIFLPNTHQQMAYQYVSHQTADREVVLGIDCDLFAYFDDELSQGRLICLAKTASNQTAIFQATAQRYGIQALLMTPLLYQHEYFGGLTLQQCDRERSWTSEEVAMVKAISDQCAIAIHQTQLFRQMQQHAHREQLLNQISRVLNTSLDPEYILQEIVKMTGECFNVDRVFIFAVETDQIHITHEWRTNDRVISMLNSHFLTANWFGAFDFEDTTRLHHPYHLPSYKDLPLNLAQQVCLEQTGRQSLLSAPIFIRDQFFGGLELHTTGQERVFLPDEILLLQRIADQTAIALYNAHSYERLEELVYARTQELEHEKHLSDAANRAKSEFLANMSHELRTPLTSILGFSSVLLKQIFGALTDRQEQYLNSIHASGDHLLELINDLLDLSKIEAEREELSFEIVHVQEIAQATLEYVREHAEAKGLMVSLVVDPTVQTCWVDRRRLKQILMNLLSNAVKFTETGSVCLSVYETDNQLQFAVKDTGIGISQVDLEQLFQPFHQLHQGLDKEYQGTGLGLALAQKLAQLHGGTIVVTSTLKQGSCFTLQLPANRSEADEPTGG